MNNRSNTGQVNSIGFAFDLGAATYTASSCSNPGTEAVNIRSTWWGNSAGPSTAPVSSTYAGAVTDACAAFTTVAGNTWDAAGNRGTAPQKATKLFTFYPWALFRGINANLTTAGGTVKIPNGPSDIPAAENDKYSKHQIVIPGLSAATRVTISSPAERDTQAAVLAQSNAASFALSSGATVTGGAPTITIQYSDPGDLGGNPEANVRLHKWNSGTLVWDLLSNNAPDTVNNIVTGSDPNFNVTGGGVYAAIALAVAPTDTPTDTPSPSPSSTATATATASPTATATLSATPSPTASNSPTATLSPTETETATPTPTSSATPSASASPTATTTATSTSTPTESATATATSSPTDTPAGPTASPTDTPTAAPSGTPTATATVNASHKWEIYE